MQKCKRIFLLESDNGASPFPSLLLLAPYFLLLARCLALPAKAFLRQFQIRGEDEGVESALVDEDEGCSIDGERIVHRLILFIHMPLDGSDFVGIVANRDSGFILCICPLNR